MLWQRRVKRSVVVTPKVGSIDKRNTQQLQSCFAWLGEDTLEN